MYFVIGMRDVDEKVRMQMKQDKVSSIKGMINGAPLTGRVFKIHDILLHGFD